MFINNVTHLFSGQPRSLIKCTNTYKTSERWILSWKMYTFWEILEIIEKVYTFKIMEFKQLEILEQSQMTSGLP